MAYCSVCNSANPDGAVLCQVCNARLNGQDAGQAQRRETVVEGGMPQGQRRPTVDESGSYSRPGGMSSAQKSSGSGAPPARRVTEYIPSAGQAASGQAAKPGAEPQAVRRMVGLLVTYTWTDQGQVFPLFEGRNRIGRDPSQCEIAIPQDESLSAVNSHILYRKQFVIGDDVSMNGTYVDGEPVETQFHPLRNYAQVRTGATVWTFIAIQPPTSDGPEPLPPME